MWGILSILSLPLYLGIFVLRLVVSSKESVIFTGCLALFAFVAFHPAVNEIKVPIPQDAHESIEQGIDKANDVLESVFY